MTATHSSLQTAGCLLFPLSAPETGLVTVLFASRIRAYLHVHVVQGTKVFVRGLNTMRSSITCAESNILFLPPVSLGRTESFWLGCFLRNYIFFLWVGPMKQNYFLSLVYEPLFLSQRKQYFLGGIKVWLIPRAIKESAINFMWLQPFF